ncbi:hypothetical protein CI088_15990 [Enterococcus plantarum]|uniref:Uncharacterized protein n=1 Tax=Enterococcus plantarum TaxID=1077675 RepID=A0A2W3YQA8_9ENTE|nr:hypothetical protein [Enterococcus plantarum]PZL70148.1 hypothetical protein CI088_15990 [Enterococcus plantarum]
MSELEMKEEAKVTFTVDLSELKKLLNKATDQVEQLQETLDEIDKFNYKPIIKKKSKTLRDHLEIENSAENSNTDF